MKGCAKVQPFSFSRIQNLPRDQIRRLRRAHDFRQSHPENAILDVDYANLVDNPLPTIQKIYDFAGQPLTPDTEAAFMRILALNRQYKYGKHQYQLSYFGFHEDVVKETYHF